MPSKAKNAVLVAKIRSLANLAGADGASGADSVAAHVSFDSLNVRAVAGALASVLIKVLIVYSCLLWLMCKVKVSIED